MSVGSARPAPREGRARSAGGSRRPPRAGRGCEGAQGGRAGVLGERQRERRGGGPPRSGGFPRGRSARKQAPTVGLRRGRPLALAPSRGSRVAVPGPDASAQSRAPPEHLPIHGPDGAAPRGGGAGGRTDGRAARSAARRAKRRWRRQERRWRRRGGSAHSGQAALPSPAGPRRKDGGELGRRPATLPPPPRPRPPQAARAAPPRAPGHAPSVRISLGHAPWRYVLPEPRPRHAGLQRVTPPEPSRRPRPRRRPLPRPRPWIAAPRGRAP